MKRSIKAQAIKPRMIGARVDGTGTAALLNAASQLTLTDNGTGDYTLAFDEAFKQVPVVVALPVTAQIQLRIGTISASSVQILAFAMDGTTATDADFHVMILGSDALDEV